MDRFKIILQAVLQKFRAARSYVYETARKLDLRKAGNRLDSDGVKLIAASAAKRIADRGPFKSLEAMVMSVNMLLSVYGEMRNFSKLVAAPSKPTKKILRETLELS